VTSGIEPCARRSRLRAFFILRGGVVLTSWPSPPAVRMRSSSSIRRSIKRRSACRRAAGDASSVWNVRIAAAFVHTRRRRPAGGCRQPAIDDGAAGKGDTAAVFKEDAVSNGAARINTDIWYVVHANPASNQTTNLADTYLYSVVILIIIWNFGKPNIYDRSIGESRISRRFQIWSQIWKGVNIKNIDFFIFNLGSNEV
jgi:hypothetical protein